MNIKKSVIIINNKFEEKIFIYDRETHQYFDINQEMFDVLKMISSNKITREVILNYIDHETLSFLEENNILINSSKVYRNNIKELNKTNCARIFMEITNKCNLNCKHCYGGFSSFQSQFIKLEDFDILLDEALKLGIYEFDLTGGEPLLHPELDLILKKLYEAGMLVTIFSNLVLFNDEILQLFKKYEVKKIITSIDSSIPAEHDKFRGKSGSFKKTIDSLKILQNEGFEVAINSMVGKHNLEYLDEHVKFLQSLKVPYLLDVIVPEGRGANLDENMIKSAEALKNVINKNKSNVDDTKNFQYCGIGERFIYIKSNGKIYICPSLIEDKFKLGIINNNLNLELLWDRMNDKYNFKKYKISKEECVNCATGCRARAYNKHGSLCADDEVYATLTGESNV